MKVIRNVVTLVGLVAAVLALGTTGANAQALSMNIFGGSVTLPFEAHWGNLTLPAGNYNLSYGQVNVGGANFVEIEGKSQDSPHLLVQIQSHNQTLTTKSALVCVRQGDAFVVEALEMPTIGQTVYFAPHGRTLMAATRSNRIYAQLAGGPMLIQRLPVRLGGN